MNQDSFYIRIGDTIENLRRDHGLTQMELAERAGVSQNCVSDVEHFERAPHMYTAYRIAQVFDLTLSELTELANV